MDLTQTFPRSPYDMNAGLVMLPRTTDKGRARLAERLGEYQYGCPLDEQLLTFLGIDEDTFLRQLESSGTDEAIAAWIAAECPRPQPEKDAFNNRLRHLAPEGEEGQAWLREQQERLGRQDYVSYFDNLDADEGRF